MTAPVHIVSIHMEPIVMRPSDFRYVYRPSRLRVPRWVSRVWGWF